jgi:hypothetical protein
LADLNSEFKFLAAAARRSVDLLRTHPLGATIRDAERGSGLSSHIEHTLVGIDATLHLAARTQPTISSDGRFGLCSATGPLD